MSYACSPEAEGGSEDWSAEDFEAKHLPAYVIRCAAWRRRYEDQQQVG
ncbi:hypothetical protein [Actinomadura sp. 6N118]